MPSGEVVRHNVGRNHWYEVDGRRFDGVTTLINKGLGKPALINWAANVTADYAVDHWDEMGQLKPSERLALLKKARFDDRDTAARRGTEVHHLAVLLVAGHEIEVPEELRGHVQSYVKFLNDWEPDPLLVEATVAHRRYRYAGTLDLVASLPNGERWIFDVKTARSGIFGETALQLCAYANAEVWVDAAGEEHTMPHVDAAAAIHVRSDGYDVYRLPLDDGVMSVFRHVAFLARAGEQIAGWVDTPLPVPTWAAS